MAGPEDSPQEGDCHRTLVRLTTRRSGDRGKKGSSNEDFEKIGTTFHTWIKDKAKLIGLEKDGQYLDFVENKFEFYSKLYLKIVAAEYKFNDELAPLYFISWFGIARSLAFPLLMAPVNVDDDNEIQNKKLQLVAHFIDCFAVNRSVNQRTLGQSSLRYTLYSLVKEPNFTKWFKKEGLPFKAHKFFNLKDIEARTGLYKQLAEKIWSADNFKMIVDK